jgi:ABC-type phosphate transport system substrate-binding protein
LSRWSCAVLCLGSLATLIAACSVLFDTRRDQCESDTDCDFINKQYTCQAGLCSDLGPRGCNAGTPSSTNPDTLQLQFKNQCSRAQVVPFDDCGRLGMCHPTTDQLPPTIAPTAGGGGGGGGTPPPAPTLECIDGKTPVVVVGGSTAVQPFMSVIAQLLVGTGFQLVYQPSGSCTGVAGLFSSDASKHVVKDIPGKNALLFSPDGKPFPDGKLSHECTFSTQNGLPPATPVALDVAASDVFAISCDPAYATPPGPIGEYFGPIQPMTFMVKAESKETSISAAMGHVVFGRSSNDPNSNPYSDPALYFVRNSGSGTQQMISRAIKVDATKWWGVDRGGSTQVLTQLQAVSALSANNAVGILSTDFADSVRGSLRILAFQDFGQLAGYYPDSSVNTRDKRNVRDGHYSIWGPVHFFAALNTNSNTLPNPAATAVVNKFTAGKLDMALLNAITGSGLVPPCAMTVKRSAEMGPLEPYAPSAACGCYFEANVVNGQAPANCKTCSGPTDCPSDKPACNFGYCEAQ